jgi:hypothetical protein
MFRSKSQFYGIGSPGITSAARATGEHKTNLGVELPGTNLKLDKIVGIYRRGIYRRTRRQVFILLHLFVSIEKGIHLIDE